MFKFKALIGLLTLSIFFSYSSKAAESQDPIKLTLHDWTGQLITTNIMAEVLKEAGYNIELVQADYILGRDQLSPSNLEPFYHSNWKNSQK